MCAAGLVDLGVYGDFASAWGSASDEPEYDAKFDFDNSQFIDLGDLSRFLEDWLTVVYYPPLTDRAKLSFNVGWKFYRGGISGDAAKNISYDDTSWEGVNVPHNPPMNPPEPDPLRPAWGTGYSYEGVSWYRKHFTVDSSYSGNKLFLEFEAVNTVANIWVNGTYLTTHYGRYPP